MPTVFEDSDLDGLDDALADDDDLVIADDDDDLVISNAGSDISVAGDSGINLMSPSDSGLSLESEPLDLAGSSISALDLGAELSDGGSSGSGIGSGSGGGSGSMVDFQADEEFQLSPSGVGLDADIESGSQVIEVEDSEAIGEAVEFGDDAFGDAGFAEVEPMGRRCIRRWPKAMCSPSMRTPRRSRLMTQPRRRWAVRRLAGPTKFPSHCFSVSL